MSQNLLACPFCNPDNSRMILDSGDAYAMTDGFPVNPGHALIIARRHCADYFDLTSDEQSACWDLVNKVKRIIDEQYCPDGYNLGINNLEAAGQTIPHVHIHLRPRFRGDVDKPRGGVRCVIPGKQDY
jgi:diadenosine tetraphosphate (Ap4A) HIT family hydrolase